MRLLDDSESAVEKSCHGRTAANTKSGAGTLPDSMPIRRRKETNTAIVTAGRRSAHAIPISVCL